MRNLEDIENDLAAAREALSKAEGTPAEVYSRIVGYYRSVRNWNKGKREEYGERRLFRLRDTESRVASPAPLFPPKAGQEETAAPENLSPEKAARTFPGEPLLLLFVRAACPACPPAKTAAGRLGIPVQLVNAGTDAGMDEALRHGVMSTPTAILLSPEGKELGRAGTAEAIAALRGCLAANAGADSAGTAGVSEQIAV